MIFKKEKEVIELIVKYLDEVVKCLASCKDALKHYIDDDIKNAKVLARQTRALESDADIIRYEIRDKLYSGAYLPFLREDIYKLVESIDMVANAAEKCCDVFLNQRPIIPDFLQSDYLDIVRKSLGVSAPLKHSVLCYLKGICPIEVSRQHAKEIGVLESKVDSMEWNITKKIFSSNLDYSHKIHLRHCLDTIVDVSDLAEDAADQLELVTLKSII